jgi:hypothetical protein
VPLMVEGGEDAMVRAASVDISRDGDPKQVHALLQGRDN